MRRGRPEELFSRIVEGGERVIDELIDTSATEELFLDYKRSADGGVGPKKLHVNDRKHYARALSGFGNGAGGVLLWGVACDDAAGRGDLPGEKVPLVNPARFKAWLEGATSGCTRPPHESVRHEVIPSTEGDRGFVVSLIPTSAYRPLRWIQKGHDGEYLVRIGSSFLPAPHEVLMGMFGQTPVPDLELDAIVCPVVRLDDGRIEVQIAVCISHTTPKLVRDVYVNAGVATDLLDGEARLRLPLHHAWESGHETEPDVLELVSRPEFRLSPTTHMRVANLFFRFREKKEYEGVIWYWLTYGCAGSQIKSHNIEVHGDDVGQVFAEFAGKIPSVDYDKDFCRKLLRLDEWALTVIREPSDKYRAEWQRSGVVTL